MELSDSHLYQLIAALSVGFIASFVTLLVSPRNILAILVVAIPFELIASRYGSLNMVATYLVFSVLLMRGRIRTFPLLVPIMMIMMVYFCSMFLAEKATWKDHLFYIVTIFSNFLLFWITFNVLSREESPKFALRLLLWMNGFSIVYSMLLFFSGFNQFVIFGIEEWALHQNHEQNKRLLGAFNAPGVTAAFYAMQVPFILYSALFVEKGWVRYIAYGMALINFPLIVASGSRGSFLTLIGGLILFVFLFRKALGFTRVLKLTVLGSAFFVLTATYIVTQTEFNVLFERLYSTEIDDSGVPDTRQKGFDMTLDRLDEALVLGHGPRVRLMDEENRRFRNFKPLGFFPHNLVLFLIYTVGFIGLLVYIFFFCRVFDILFRARLNKRENLLVRMMPRLGLIFMIMLFVDQLKIEYLRFMFGDFQHYIFYILGMVLAFSYTNNRKQLSIN